MKPLGTRELHDLAHLLRRRLPATALQDSANRACRAGVSRPLAQCVEDLDGRAVRPPSTLTLRLVRPSRLRPSTNLSSSRAVGRHHPAPEMGAHLGEDRQQVGM